MTLNIKETAVNVFSRRHTPEAPLSHSTLDLEEVAELLRVATSTRDGYEPDNYEVMADERLLLHSHQSTTNTSSAESRLSEREKRFLKASDRG